MLGGEERCPPGAPRRGEAGSHHPGQASGTRRGCQAWEGRRDVTRKQLKMQAPGKLEQLQHSPSTGCWQDRQTEQPAGTVQAENTPEENPAGRGSSTHEQARSCRGGGVGSKAESKHVPEAQNKSVPGSPCQTCIQSKPPPCRAWIQRAAGRPWLGIGLGTWPRLPRFSARRAPR